MEDNIHMTKLEEIKIAICQMPVVPGRPDINFNYIIKEISKASERKIDIIVFPEMCLTGYIIGDLYEDDSFVRDARNYNERIREATRSGITVIFGTLTFDPYRIGEDGRLRKFNSGLIAQNGEWIGRVVKTLQPNYRIFDDDRYFYSSRKLCAEAIAEAGADKESNPACDMKNYFNPLPVKIGNREIRIGVKLCEDMWHDDYPLNPAKGLVANGAEILFNLSASPWTWQKNRKRHQVVKGLLAECKVPLVYVNNTGIQNTGKNIVIFDGSSTVYDRDGDILYQVPAFDKGTHDIVLNGNSEKIKDVTGKDTHELYLALKNALEEFLLSLPPEMRKVVIGVSGGIDSALTLAMFTHILGPENVWAINMPYQFSSRQTKAIFRKLAKNLKVNSEVRPIKRIVNAIAKTAGTEPGTLAFENIQARARMEVLSARAQEMGCVFSANWNKVEAAFGYGTLYGDMAGFVASIGDLVKREVYQLADYLNKEIFKEEVIPDECFRIAPSAELSQGQKDPFDYGNLEHRGYHDEMVRAFTEFRKNPEWFLELYIKGELEKELKLEPGHLKTIFRSGREFVKDLEKNWLLFYRSFFKRVQGAPIPIVSKRAFGTDLRESLITGYFTIRYRQLKERVFAEDKPEERLAIFGGSFNPPGIHHRGISSFFSDKFDHNIVYPCGWRSDKPSANIVPLEHRLKMVEMNFRGINNVGIDLTDLQEGIYTPTWKLQEYFEKLYPKAEIWHVIGSDIISGGAEGKSEIQVSWDKGKDIWNRLNWLVVTRPGYEYSEYDLPPWSQTVQIKNIFGSGTLIRERLGRNEPIDDLVLPEIKEYIEKHKLYKN
jgi:NAD+ synthase (glutamine-hydrolysing)